MAVTLAAPAVRDDPLRGPSSRRGGQGRSATGGRETPRGKQHTAAGDNTEWGVKCHVNTLTDMEHSEGERVRDWTATGHTLGRGGGKGNREAEEQTQGAKVGGVGEDLAIRAICKKSNGGEDDGKGAAGGPGMTGSLFAPAVSQTAKGNRSRASMTASCFDAVLPLALPGEAREASFGAVARGLVLASGSSRFQVSR